MRVFYSLLFCVVVGSDVWKFRSKFGLISKLQVKFVGWRKKKKTREREKEKAKIQSQ